MNYLVLLLLLPITFAVTAQKIEIEAVDHPYFDIIEWKGMGAMLMSKDPSGNSKQINLTLVGNHPTSIWDQKFTPKGEEYFYVSSENARYVYFLDNLELKNGKVYFSQLNSAGNIKSTSVSFISTIKKLGAYDYNKLELINIVVTDKALVHHFRYNDKKNKQIVELAVFMTHHNFLTYGVELGNVSYAQLKDQKYGHSQFIGFTGDRILFAARDYQNKTRGWTVKEFTSKGKPKLGIFLNTPDNLIPIENIGFGTTGSYYLEDKASVEFGLLSFINSKFYLVGAEKASGSGAEITLYELIESEWKTLNEMQLNYFIENKNLKLGVYPMNEGVGYHLDHNGYNKVSMIYYASKEAPHNDFTKRTIYNPSSVFERKKKEEFNVILTNGLLKFDTSQLGKKGSVEFEIVK